MWGHRDPRCRAGTAPRCPAHGPGQGKTGRVSKGACEPRIRPAGSASETHAHDHDVRCVLLMRDANLSFGRVTEKRGPSSHLPQIARSHLLKRSTRPPRDCVAHSALKGGGTASPRDCRRLSSLSAPAVAGAVTSRSHGAAYSAGGRGSRAVRGADRCCTRRPIRVSRTPRHSVGEPRSL